MVVEVAVDGAVAAVVTTAVSEETREPFAPYVCSPHSIHVPDARSLRDELESVGLMRDTRTP